MSGIGWDIEAISSRLAHDAAALSRQINLWSCWAAEDLEEGTDITPLLGKIRNHAQMLSGMIQTAQRLSTIEAHSVTRETLNLRDCVELSRKSLSAETSDVRITGEGRAEGDSILVLLAMRLVQEESLAWRMISIEPQQITFHCDAPDDLETLLADLAQPERAETLRLHLPMASRIMARQGGRAEIDTSKEGEFAFRLIFN